MTTVGTLAMSPSYRFSRDVRVRPARRIELLAYLSAAFDLAEGETPGHAARVAFLGSRVAEELGLGAEERRRVLHVGLLHGVRHVGCGDLAAALDLGAYVAERLHLDEQVAEALLGVHERWDGRGEPRGLSGHQVPLEALCVSAAHWAMDVASRVGHPLRARAVMQRMDAPDTVPLAGPLVSEALADVLRGDDTWLTLWDDDLPAVIGMLGAGEGKPSRRKVMDVAAVMGEVVDAAVRESGRSERVAALARILGVRMGLPDGVCDALEVAGHLLDLGQLGVPREVTEKPSILTVDEMELMRRHPGLGARLLEGAPGMAEIAGWVEQHHERPDGRGYPEMLAVEDLPLPPRILAVADAYCALRADRPYRQAFSEQDALAMLDAGAGRQFDADVVAVLPGALRVLAEVEQETATTRLRVLTD
ncbi:MAG: HD domain-containing protein [Chloroflexi bacterium]|nr:HD domain-containing protein [Chloroflexota bacterium]